MTSATIFELLPAIDLRGGRVVRLEQGDFTRETSFSDDPVAAATGFADAGARWLHVVDLDGARSGTRTHPPVIAAIVAAVGDRARVEIAGGLRDEPSVAEALATGATRVVVGTRAIEEPAFAGRLVAAHGADRVVAAIDIREGRAVGRGWATGQAGVDALDVIERLSDLGIETFEVTAIDRDGLLDGPDLALYERIARSGRGSVIASGGIATLDDIRAVRGTGCVGAIVGRSLYDGRLNLTAALAVAR